MQADAHVNASLLKIKAKYEKEFGRELPIENALTVLNFPLRLLRNVSDTRESVAIIGLGRFGVKTAREEELENFFNSEEGAPFKKDNYIVNKANKYLELLGPTGTREYELTAKNVYEVKEKEQMASPISEEDAKELWTKRIIQDVKSIKGNDPADMVKEFFGEVEKEEPNTVVEPPIANSASLDDVLSELTGDKKDNSEDNNEAPTEEDFADIW